MPDRSWARVRLRAVLGRRVRPGAVLGRRVRPGAVLGRRVRPGAVLGRRVRLRAALGRTARRFATSALARLRPTTPPAVWAGLVAARSMAGHGPVVLAPAAREVLVLAAHPDDETIGCAGTVSGLVVRGARVAVLVATSGEASVADPGQGRESTATARRAEVTAACAELGTEAPTVLDLPDGRLSEHVEVLVGEIRRALAMSKPTVIFVPWPLDDHPDHRAMSVALVSAGVEPGTEIWGYEVWSPLPANSIVDITASWERKVRALACHASAHHAVDATAHLALSRWRSLFGLDGHGWAEAFLVLDAGDLATLVAVAAGRSGSPA